MEIRVKPTEDYIYFNDLTADHFAYIVDNTGYMVVFEDGVWTHFEKNTYLPVLITKEILDLAKETFATKNKREYIFRLAEALKKYY